jgi:UDP-glucuronate decarboxylase
MIYGDGSQTRSFCYVDDLVDACVRLMDSEDGFVGPVNLGNPHEISIHDLAKLIIELTGSTSKLEYRPLPVDDPRQRCPDISRALEKLDWAPTTPLDTGLRRTIAYFESVLSKERGRLAP